MKITASGKRGRTLRTVETGREVSHEEVLNGLVKRTAVEAVDGAICIRCGEPTDKRRKGPSRVLCLPCKVERNRENGLAVLRRRGRPVKGKYNVSAARALAGAAKNAARKREYAAEVRAERIAARLCVQCGKEPASEGASRGEACKMKRRERRTKGGAS